MFPFFNVIRKLSEKYATFFTPVYSNLDYLGKLDQIKDGFVSMEDEEKEE